MTSNSELFCKILKIPSQIALILLCKIKSTVSSLTVVCCFANEIASVRIKLLHNRKIKVYHIVFHNSVFVFVVIAFEPGNNCSGISSLLKASF